MTSSTSIAVTTSIIVSIHITLTSSIGSTTIMSVRIRLKDLLADRAAARRAWAGCC